MPWFKVDDTLAFHAKVVAAGNAAMGLWVRAGAWSSQQLTEGHVPQHIAVTLGTAAEAKRLVTVKLWEVSDDGYRFWQWTSEGRQPTKAAVEQQRHDARERQRRAREKAKSQRESRRDGDVTNGVSHAPVTPVVTVPPTRPDPTRPEIENQLGGDRPETLRASHATKPPTCSKHPDGDSPTPCPGCAKVRAYQERADAQATERAAAEAAALARGCIACEGTGFILDADKNPTRKCTHRGAA